MKNPGCLVICLAMLPGVGVQPKAQEASQPCNLNGKVVAAINEMSASVGGSGFPSLGCVDFPGGREVQMYVVAQDGQRWILGVDLASAATRTRLKVSGNRSALLAVTDGAEPRYGTLGTQPVTSVVGTAMNQQLTRLGSASISSVTVSGGQQPVFLVSWKSAGADASGQFTVDSKGAVSLVPKKQ